MGHNPSMRSRVLIALFLFAALLPAGLTPEWNKPIAPYRVISNVYYVGTNFLATFLITTPDGDILINPDYQESVPVIRRSVEKLGFHFSDIKIILISHSHDDHAAGCALMKKLTGAKLMVMDADVAEIENGGASDFAYESHWAPAKVDRVLHDGDKVTLGGFVLTAHLTPGHTKGCTTWTTEVRDGGHLYHVVIVGSVNVNSEYKLVNNRQYPTIATDYEKTFRVLSSLPCDVFLGAHGAYYNMDEKLKRPQTSGTNPFIDPAGYRAFVAESEQAFRSKLAAQQQAAKHT